MKRLKMKTTRQKKIEQPKNKIKTKCNQKVVGWEPPTAMSEEKRLFQESKRVEAGQIHFENLEKENLNKPHIVEK